jgi:glycosyltransferase involved in cell wall biosynthesis
LGKPAKTGGCHIFLRGDKLSFAVIIPTRNRPAELEVAIRSVLRQSQQPDELIVVDDGSDCENIEEIRNLVNSFGGPVRLIELLNIKNGHGPAYSRNAGIQVSSSTHICFLDDDDYWIDKNYLSYLNKIVEFEDLEFDVHFCNQKAFDGSVEITRSIWIAELSQIVEGRPCEHGGEYIVSVDDILRCTGFCHLNTTCVRKEFFQSTGGFNDEIRYESDRDFFLRAIDSAKIIKYSQKIVAVHNIPDKIIATSVSTSISNYNRWLFQLKILERISIEAQHSQIRYYARKHKSYTLKKIAKNLYDEGNYRRAWVHARTALLTGFSVRWALFTMLAMGAALLEIVF